MILRSVQEAFDHVLAPYFEGVQDVVATKKRGSLPFANAIMNIIMLHGDATKWIVRDISVNWNWNQGTVI